MTMIELAARDIPADVMEKARALWQKGDTATCATAQKNGHVCDECDNTPIGFVCREGAEVIASALLEERAAERERCVEICLARLGLYDNIGQHNAIKECISSICAQP